jgi:mannose/fructose/N-acetylgalactosamine-specific phosphotransferase system component IID
MYLVAIAWMYVVLMMAVAEATSPQGTVLGAVFTFVLYGLMPLAIVLYILGTPGRRRALKAAEAASDAASVAAAASAAPDGSGHAAGDAVAAERKEG